MSAIINRPAVGHEKGQGGGSLNMVSALFLSLIFVYRNKFSLPYYINPFVISFKRNKTPYMPTHAFLYRAFFRRKPSRFIDINLPVLAIWTFHVYPPSVSLLLHKNIFIAECQSAFSVARYFSQGS
jgi:hypothetical protein